MFVARDGSAPDIAGTGAADPTAAIASVALMLEHLGLAAEAARVTAAVEADIAERGEEPRTTSEIGDAITVGVQA